MKKLLVSTILLSTSLTTQAQSIDSVAMKCVSTALEVLKLPDSIEPFPKGLWISKKADKSGTLRFYIDQDYRTALLSTSNTSVGVRVFNNHIEVCFYNERSFIKARKQYIEYYFEGDNLKIAKAPFDIQDPRDRSQFNFDTSKPAHIVLK